MTTRGITVLAGGLKETQEITRLAEAAGFDAAWTSEFLHRSGIVSAAAMAAATTRIEVGTAIAYAVGRSPLVLANDARFLDEMSDGRFTLGLGTGTRRMMTDWHGVPDPDGPASRIEELVPLLRQLWRLHEGPVRHQGRFALGTMTFGERRSWGIAEPAARLIMDKFAEAGGTFIDTANIYADGDAERILGNFLRPDRDRFVVGTKYTLQTRPGDLNSAGSHRKNLVRSVEASLRSLGTDYVDLLWVHTREAWTPVVEVMRALDDLVRTGKVLYIGASDWPAWEVAEANTMAALRGWTPFTALQSRYNMLERTPEGDLLPMADAFGLAVVAWGPLAEGRLTGKYRDGGQGRLRDDAEEGLFQHSWSGPEETVDLVVRIAGDIGCTPAQVALAWLAARPGNIIPLLGATSVAQLDENLAAAGIRVDDDQLRVLDKASAPALGFPHDLLRRENVTIGTYGDQWRLVDDRGTRTRPGPSAGTGRNAGRPGRPGL